MAVTVSDVQAIYGEKSPAIDSTKQQALLDVATRLKDDVFGGRLTHLSEIEGDQDDFIKYLAAHLWEIAEGGEASGHSQTGGNVNYQHLQGNISQTLSETRYGRVAQMFLRNESSIGIVRSDW